MTRSKMLVLFTVIGVVVSISGISAYAIGGYTETTKTQGQIVNSGEWFTAFDLGGTEIFGQYDGATTGNVLISYPIEVSNDTVVKAIGMGYSGTTPTASCRAGIYSDDGNRNPSTLLVDSGNF